MKLEKNAKMYGTLFSSVFMLSACTFGGGYVIVPLMRKKFVEDLHWIEEGEMMDLVAIARSNRCQCLDQYWLSLCRYPGGNRCSHRNSTSSACDSDGDILLL